MIICGQQQSNCALLWISRAVDIFAVNASYSDALSVLKNRKKGNKANECRENAFSRIGIKK